MRPPLCCAQVMGCKSFAQAQGLLARSARTATHPLTVTLGLLSGQNAKVEKALTRAAAAAAGVQLAMEWGGWGTGKLIM